MPVQISGHTVGEIRLVKDMHTRKAVMFEEADAFIAIPGFHTKPVGLLNVENFFDSLLAFVDHATAEGFIRPASRSILVSARTPAELLDALERYKAPPSLIKLASEGQLSAIASAAAQGDTNAAAQAIAQAAASGNTAAIAEAAAIAAASGNASALAQASAQAALSQGSASTVDPNALKSGDANAVANSVAQGQSSSATSIAQANSATFNQAVNATATAVAQAVASGSAQAAASAAASATGLWPSQCNGYGSG
eukprot:scaffold1.g5639.t1